VPDFKKQHDYNAMCQQLCEESEKVNAHIHQRMINTSVKREQKRLVKEVKEANVTRKAPILIGKKRKPNEVVPIGPMGTGSSFGGKPEKNDLASNFDDAGSIKAAEAELDLHGSPRKQASIIIP
jgi:hypothetical protein